MVATKFDRGLNDPCAKCAHAGRFFVGELDICDCRRGLWGVNLNRLASVYVSYVRFAPQFAHAGLSPYFAVRKSCSLTFC